MEKENEITTNDNIESQADTLTDLPVAGEPAEDTKGGSQFNSASINVLLGDGSAR